MANLADNYPGIREGATLPLQNLAGGGLVTFGTSWYVSSATTGNFIGSDTANNGRSPGAPFATLSAARAAATANNGDVIFLLPGHAETITAAAGSGVTKAGLTIVGLGQGSLRPTFTFTTAAAASFNITAANTLIQNCVFTCSIDAQTAMINVTAADVSFIDCDINTSGSSTTTAVLGILTAATATRLKVLRCRFLGIAGSTSTTTASIQHESGVDYIIQECHFVGKQTQAVLNVATVLRGIIHNNVVVVGTGTSGFTMAAGSTPMITNNRFNVASGTTPVTAAAGFVAGNIYSAAAGVVTTGETSSTSVVARW